MYYPYEIGHVSFPLFSYCFFMFNYLIITICFAKLLRMCLPLPLDFGLLVVNNCVYSAGMLKPMERWGSSKHNIEQQVESVHNMFGLLLSI